MNVNFSDRANSSFRLIAGGLIFLIVLYIVQSIIHVLLLLFSGLLLAVLFDGLTAFIIDRIRIPRGLALTFVVTFLFGLLFLFERLAGANLLNQLSLLIQRIPSIISDIKDELADHPWLSSMMQNATNPKYIFPSSSDVLGRITGIFSLTLSIMTDLVIVFFLGIYLAASPHTYTDNFMRLFPIHRRKRMHEAASALGRALRWWLFGRITSMTLVGILTLIGLWIIHMPLAFTLAFIAGTLSFVPYLGAIVSAVPAVIVALGERPVVAIYVVIVFTIVHVFEGYIITPLIQERTVSIPPAMLFTVQILMGMLVGVSGVLLATPLAVVVIAGIQMFYVQDVLGDKVHVMGEH